ncbi:MAG: gas vesicle protein GvpO [Actinopolymorphaceae bacterium]
MAGGRRDDPAPERGGYSSTTGDHSPVGVSRKAMDQLSELTSREVEGVSRLEHDEAGWLFNIEIVELDRIPDSTSVLASYETRTDDDGNVVSYHRTRRYTRNQAGEL